MSSTTPKWFVGGLRSGILAVALAAVMVNAVNCSSSETRIKADDEVAGTLKARAFVVVDEAGRERAELATGADDEAWLRLYSTDGQRTLWAGVGSDGLPSIALLNRAQEPVVEVGMFNDAEPFWVLRDKAGNPRLGAKMLQSGDVGLTVFDVQGKPRSHLVVDENGLPALKLCDKDGSTRTQLAVDKDGLPRIVLFDKNGPRAVTRIYEDGQVAFDLADANKNIRVGMVSDADPAGTSAVMALSKEGEVIVTMPSQPDGELPIAPKRSADR